MSLMLVALFAALLYGIFASRGKPLDLRITAGVATLLTLVYFLRPQYMT
jgi:hypothetical protein